MNDLKEQFSFKDHIADMGIGFKTCGKRVIPTDKLPHPAYVSYENNGKGLMHSISIDSAPDVIFVSVELFKLMEEHFMQEDL